MEKNYPDKASHIFQAAVERDPSERASFLTEACGDDAALRSEVESLLCAHEQAGSFLEVPPLEIASAVLEEERIHSRIGRRVGSFNILSLIGSGGMGEVYRAQDTRLARTVAIKFLPSRFSDNPDLRQRLEREALAVSRLNHPNICTLFDIGRHEDADFLVMEHLEGETLEQRLTRGALPLQQSLRYGAQIADALQAAHRQGITHRDVKPANIMLVGDSCKLLDFGLAKLHAPFALAAASGSLTAPGRRPTLKGTILGTVQYMAPEQLEGKEVDGRTDIFGFGALLYEMVTGHKAFQGKSNASLIAAIMSTNPAPVSTLQPMSPRALDHLVRRCLAKKPEERWQTALDVKKELEWILEGESGEGGVEADRKPRQTSRREWLVRTAGAATGLAAGFVIFRSRDVASPDESAERFRPALPFGLALPENMVLASTHAHGGPAVSPDGSIIVLAARRNGKTHLYLRRRASIELEPLQETENAHHPFWNPNSKEIGFFADGWLKTVRTSGGKHQTLCQVSQPQDTQAKGGAWNDSDDIIFMDGDRLSSLSRFQLSTNKKERLTTLDVSKDERWHCWPCFLPDQRHFLYLVWSPIETSRAVYAGSLDDPGLKELILRDHASSVIYAAGHLLYVKKDRLMAEAFDPVRRKLLGSARPIDDLDPVVVPSNYRAGFSAANTGFLVIYGEGKGRLARFDRDDGGRSYLPLNEDRYATVRISPDSAVLFYYVMGPRESSSSESLNPDVAWMRMWHVKSRMTESFKSVAGSSGRLTFTPDSRHVFFSGREEFGVTPRSIYRTTLTRGHQPKLILETKDSQLTPLHVSHDDRFLLILRSGFRLNRTSAHMCYVELGSDGLPVNNELVRFDDEPGFTMAHGRFSPKGLSKLWVAYTADMGNGQQVYVRRFPPTKETVPIAVTSDGGKFPVWTKGGKEIVFQSSNNHLVAASLEEVNSELIVRKVDPFFLLPESSLADAADYELRTWDATPDGRAVYFIESQRTPVTVVDDWRSKLKA